MMKLESKFWLHPSGGLMLEYSTVINGERMAVRGVMGEEYGMRATAPASYVCKDMQRQLMRHIEKRLFHESN